MANPYDDLVGSTASANPYDAMLDADAGVRVRSAAVAARGVSPDTAARADEIARRNGWEPDVVRINLPEFEEEDRLAQMERAAQADPRLGGWLSDPKRAALAQDDLPALSRLSGAVMRATTPHHERTWSEFARDAGTTFKQGARGAFAGLAETPVNAINAVNRWFNGAANGLAGIFGQSAGPGVPMLEQPGAVRWLRGSADAIAERENEGQSFKLAAQQAGRPETFVAGVGYTLRNPSMLATDVTGSAGAMAGSGLVPGSTWGTVAMQATAQAGMAADDAKKRVLKRGGSEQQAQAAAADAYTLALGVGLVAPNLFRGGTAFESLLARDVSGLTGSTMRRSATALAGETISETGEEAGVAAATNIGAGDPIGQGVGGAAAAGLTTGLAFAAPAAGREVFGTYAEGQRARERDSLMRAGRLLTSAEDAATTRASTAAANESKTIERAPDEAAALLGDDRYYVSVDEARALYQSDDVPFEAWAAEVTGDPDVLDSADLSIPSAKWHTIIAKLPNWSDWVDHSRRDPESYSLKDLADAEKMAAEFPDLFATDEAAERAAPADADAREQIKQDVLGQLIGSGRYKQGEAEIIADLTARQFTTMAGRAGRDALELWRGYDLRVRAQQTAPGKPRGLDDRTAALFRAARTHDIPDGSRVFGKSLAQFVVEAGGVVDDGGDLASRDAAKQRPGLINNRAGLPLDRARELAAEAGYLPADSTVADFLDLLSQDVDGSPVYANGAGDPNLQAFRNDALKLQRDIDEAFQSADPRILANLTDEQVAEAMSDARVMAKLLGQPMPGLWGKLQDVARSLYQAAFHGTPHKGIEKTGFKMEKMGTGEGAQAFGWGMYFASLREVAESYREVLSEGPPAEFTVDGVVQFTGKPTTGDPRETAIYALANGANPDNLADGYADMGASEDFVEGVRMAVEALRGKKIERVETPAGQTYQVDIPEDGDLLDWDKPLPQQPEKVRQALRAVLELVYAGAPGDPITPAQNAEYMLANSGSTGRDLYGDMTKALGSDEAASKMLLEAGIPGLRYLDGVSRSGGEGTHNYVIWDESAIKVERTFYAQPRRDAAPRGSLTIAGDRTMTVDLFERADRSTFLHEMGHFYLEVMRDLASAADAPAEIVADFDTILRWGGIEGDTPEARRATWAGMSLDQQRHLHEGWAEGFEQFLLEGKAPAPDLVGPFARFAAWMRSIYGAMRQLRIPLSDDIRAVMERMVATDEEIEAVRARQNMGPVIDEATATAAGISPEQYAEVKAKLEAGRDAALARVHKQVMAALTRERKAWWKDELARVTEEVEAEFESAPIVRAWRVLASRKPDGLPPELAGLKLDGEAVKQVIGTPTIPESIRNLGVTGKAGVHPDAAAIVLGFRSGSELLQGLSTVRDLAARVEAEAKARMIERHGDPLLDGTLAEKAMRAAHNSAQVRGLEAELAMLEQMAADPTATPEKPATEGAAPREPRTLTPEQKQRLREQAAARARVGRAFKKLAEDKIAGQRVRDLRPNEHLAAERRAAKKAAEAAAKGDFVAATKAKREQILHIQLYRAARNAQGRVEKSLRHVKRIGKKPARQRIGKAGLLDMLEGVLGAYTFRPASDKARDRAAKLREYVLTMQAAGVDLQVAPEVIAQMEAEQPIHYRDLPMGKFDEVMALVRQIEHQAQEANTARLAGEKIELDTAAAELAETLTGAFADRGPNPISEVLKRTFAERAKRAARLSAAWLVRLPSLANWVDGEGNVNGAFHRFITRPLDRADATYRDMVKQYGERVLELFEAHLKGADLTAPIHIASIGQPLARGDILAIALNTGNASNLQRLRDGMGWGDVQLAEILGHLTPADVEFVQGVWDTLDSLWPLISAQQERMTGVKPPRIGAQPITLRLADGSTATLRGGYYPLVYDRESVAWRSFVQGEGDALFEPMAMMSLPPNGFTKQRVEAARIPLKFDLAIIPQHLGMVLKDLTHRETVLGIQKLIRQPAATDALTRTLGPEAGEAIESKLRQIATEQFLQGGGKLWGILGKGSRMIRRNVGLMAMGYNVVSGLKQILGIAGSTEVMLARFGYRGPQLLAQGYKRMLEPGAIDDMKALSGFMRHRLDTADNEIRLTMQQYLAGNMSGSKWGRAANLHAGSIAHAYIAIQYMQAYSADIPLWLAAFKGGIGRGMNEADAAALADDTVQSGQGSGNPAHNALIEQQIPVLEWLTMFYSYGSAYLNRQITLGRDIGKAVKGGPVALFREMPLLSARFAMLAVFPVIAEEVINIAVGASKGAGDEDEDGDEDDLADRAWHFGKRIAAFQFYGVPGLRDIAGAKYGFRLSPVQSAVDAWSKVARDIEKGFDPDEDVEARKVVRNAVHATGYALGLPLAGPWKHIDYLWRVLEGEEEPESIPEFAAAAIVAKREAN